jgi:anti-anti-sigma factor
VSIRHDATGCHAEVHGTVDISTEGPLARLLLTGSCGGTLPLTVDLTGVPLLASAGVRVVYQLSEQLTANHQKMALQMPPHSLARAVIDLVRLSYAPAETRLNYGLSQRP